MLLSDLTGDDFRSLLLQALQDPEVINFLHQVSDFNEGPSGLHHELGNRHDQASFGDHNHDGISSSTPDFLVQAIFEAGILLKTQTFPNILFAPGAGAVTTQIIAGSSLNFDVATGNAFNFRNGINGTTVAYIDTVGGFYATGPTAGFNFLDRDGVGGDYFAWYASSGGAGLYSSVLGGNAFLVLENGNASTIGSHFFQSTSYGGRFGAGNDPGATSIVQIALGYHGTQDSYRHEIKSMHDGGSDVNNRVSIWIWRTSDVTTADPSLKVAEWDGTGNMTLAGTILCGAGSPSFAGVSTATSAAAGAATALPSPPVGYWIVTLNGTNRKIPYYA